MNSDTYSLFYTIGKCHQTLKNHAKKIALRSSVKAVTQWSDISIVDEAFRLEEYVDAELSSGQAISWRLEVTLTRTEIMVEADVRRIHGEGQDVIATIADCEYRSVIDGSIAIAEITKKLCAIDHV